jgi:MSHA biogenesis protein MshP
MRTIERRRNGHGFLVIAAVFLLVVLAGLVAYLMTVSTTSQAASAADFNSARAYQAARAGAEWAAYQILRNPGGGTFRTACAGATVSRNLTFASTLAGYTATVTCTGSASLTEGASSVRAYSIVSNACNVPTGGGACPNGAALSGTYVERQVTLVLTQ